MTLLLALPSLTHGQCSPRSCPDGGQWVLKKVLQGGKELVTDARMDKWWRRVTPQSKGPKTGFLALLGGSQVFGQWLKDDQTLSANLARQLPELRHYNYGFPGQGGADVLGRIQDSNLREQIDENKGLFLYLHFPFHLYRIYPNVHSVGLKLGRTPLYEVHDGKLYRRGTFQSRHPWTTWAYLGLNRLFPNRVFPKAGPKEKALECEIIKTMKDSLARVFPQSNFAVVTVDHGGGAQIGNACFVPNAIAHMDLTSIKWRKPHKIPGDGHYTASASAQLAEEIAVRLTPALRRLTFISTP